MEGIHFARAWRRRRAAATERGLRATRVLMGKKLSWGMKLACTGGVEGKEQECRESTLELLFCRPRSRRRRVFSSCGARSPWTRCLFINVFRRGAASNDPAACGSGGKKGARGCKRFQCFININSSRYEALLSDLRHAVLLLHWTGLPVTTWDKLKRAFRYFQSLQGHGQKLR